MSDDERPPPFHPIFLLGMLVALVTGLANMDDYSHGWLGFVLGGALMLVGGLAHLKENRR